MDSTKTEFDISIFKKIIQEEPTKENGWSLAIDDIINKEWPDCKIKVYKKIEDGESALTTITETIMKGVKIEEFFNMITDTKLIAQADKKTKQLKVIEQLSKNSDIIYREIEFPFPFASREFISKRVYLSSQNNAELAKELGISDLGENFYILMQKGTERAEYPVKDKPVRAETKIGCCLFQEDPKNPGVIIAKFASCTYLNGNLPVSLVNKLGPKSMQELISDMLKSYSKLFGRE